MNKLKSLEGFDSGSNYKFGDKKLYSNQSRSLFDLSHLVTMTIDNAGLLIPITWFPTVPNDDFDINVDVLLRVMPQVVPLYSRQRLYVYGFYARGSDLYQNFQVFMDKGYTGNVEKQLPILHHGNESGAIKNIEKVTEGDAPDISQIKIQPNTLFDYMGLPVGGNFVYLFSDDVGNAGINALPFMMYLRIYRDYFMNKNEWINDRVMLPDDDSRFRLNDDGELLSAKDEGKVLFFGAYNDITVNDNVYKVGLLFHDYPDDYFTSALPFSQRGSTPTLNFSVDTSQLKLKVNPNTGAYDIFSNPYGGESATYFDIVAREETPASNADIGVNTGTSSGATINMALNTAFNNNVIKKFGITGDSISLGITLEDIRRLAIEQIELEQLARTDGSYREFGLSFFGESSRASYDYRPTYIGGTYKNIVFTEVLQTSGSTIPTTGESDSPLGAYAGHGITGISNGRIGHIHCDDYGYIMLIACIMPDVYYSQGIDKKWTDILQSDMYLPDRAKLGLQPIYNKELYYAGNNSNESGGDNYLWAYQNIFDSYRYIPNAIRGKIADPTNESFFPYTQSRKFDRLVNWGREFSEAKDVRKDYLFSAEESAYSAQFSCNIRAVRPIPYKSVPAQIIN